MNKTSVLPGEDISFHASTDSARFDIVIEREGLDNAPVARFADLKGENHPIPEEVWAKGCGWPAAQTLCIPTDWPSGAYRVRFRTSDPPSEHSELFVVRPSKSGAISPILIQLCTNTYQAYNNWGGRSLYAYNSQHYLRGHLVSFDRPGLGYLEGCLVTDWETPFIRWAESEGYTLEYAANSDLEFHPEMLDSYRLLLSVGHDEYWSSAMRDAVEGFIGRGGNVAFFSGNCVCWQVRFEDGGRKMRCHKEVGDEDPLYMSGDHRLLTTRWSAPALKRPENTLTGVGFDYGGYHRSHGMHMAGSGAYTVRRADHWVYEGTGLEDGDSFGGESTIVGYETDGCLFEIGPAGRPYPTGVDGTPASFEILAQAPASMYAGHNGMATMGVYTRGGTVFTAGTTDWAHGLAKDPAVQRITHNVLRRLSV